MTNKEAIGILQTYIEVTSESQAEAIELAIKALQDLGYAQGYIDGSTGADWREEE